jgi:hypothetical protein
MADQIETTIGTCKWRLDGRCYRRLKRRRLVVNGKRTSRPSRGLPTALDLLDHIRRKGSVEEIPKCDAVDGSPCLLVPEYKKETRELFLGGKLVRRFKKESKQATLLGLFQSLGWPESVDDPQLDPSSYDPENGLSDIVYELNQDQKPRQRIRFWCDHHSVYWELVGNQPSR